MSKKYGDTVNSTEYVKVEQPHAQIIWRSGEAKLLPILKSDPPLVLGGWRAGVERQAKGDKPYMKYPELPWPVYERENYKNYGETVGVFKIVTSRERFVLVERDAERKVIKNQYGFPNVLGVSKTWQEKYSPYKEVACLVCDNEGEEKQLALITIDSWSAYKSWNKAEKTYQAKDNKDGSVLLRKFGTAGKLVGDKVTVNSVEYNGGKTTPIEAMHLGNPIYSPITEDFENLWESLQTWKNCPMWNKEFSPDSIIPNEESELPPMPEPSEDFPFGDPTQD